jgi:hypothetical protein
VCCTISPASGMCRVSCVTSGVRRYTSVVSIGSNRLCFVSGKGGKGVHSLRCFNKQIVEMNYDEKISECTICVHKFAQLIVLVSDHCFQPFRDFRFHNVLV